MISDSTSFSDDDSGKQLLSLENGTVIFIEPKRDFQFWFIQAMLFCLSASLLLTSLTLKASPSVARCNKIMEMPSPVHDVLKDELIPTRINGHFSDENEYKGPPTPERDAAWDDLINHGGTKRPCLL